MKTINLMITYFVEFMDGTVITIPANDKKDCREKARQYENKHGPVKEIM